MKAEMKTDRLPFFVYGTLLPGQANDYLWGESIEVREPAVFAGGRLYDMGAYPMLVESEDGGRVRGFLVSVHIAEYDQIIARLDVLEGYDPERPDESPYRRVRRRVQTAAGRSLAAWVYLGQAHSVTDRPAITSGDWASYAAGKPEIAAWWAREKNL